MIHALIAYVFVALFGSESYRFSGTGNEKLQCATWQDFGESTSSYLAFNIILSIRQIPQNGADILAREPM